MKVTLSAAPEVGVQQASASQRRSAAAIARIPARAPLDADTRAGLDDVNLGRTFRLIYDTWFEDVSRWIRAFGGLESDRDDIAQEVFLVVRRRLSAFDGANPAGWLYRITRRQVRDFRRRSWVKHIFNKRRSDEPDILPHAGAGPAAALEHKEKQRILHTLLQKMNEDRRCAFVLFEIDGLSGEEIARIQSIPLNTVWTRLHHARKEFFALAAKYQKTSDFIPNDDRDNKQHRQAPIPARTTTMATATTKATTTAPRKGKARQ